MNHSTSHHSAGFRWMSLLLSFVLLLSGIGAGPTPQPPEPPSPALVRAEQWDAAPLAPLSNHAAPAPAPAEQAATSDDISSALYAGTMTWLMNNSTTFIHQVYNYSVGNWEIKYGTIFQQEVDTVVASHPAADTQPRLSYDAKQAVFVSNRSGNADIFVTALAGGDVRQLTTDAKTDTMPAFSPDGQRIVFVSDRTGNPEIFVMNADGSGQIAINADSAVDVNPDWSPDGKRIAFVRRSGVYGQIMLINADGTGMTALTGALYLLGRVRWSPTGTKLAFEYDHNGDSWIEIGVVNADGSGFARLFQNSPPAPYDDYELGNWANDESYLTINRIIYWYDRDGWYIDKTYPGLVNYPSGEIEQRNHPDITMAADLRNPDRGKPVSGINQLPEFTKQNATLSGSYWAEDFGPAGLYSTEVFCSRDGKYWWPLASHHEEAKGVSPGSYTFENSFGGDDVLYFRVEALDWAGNAETKPVQPEAFTRLYRIQLQGNAADLRGRPLNGVEISGPFLNQPVTGPAGTTTIYVGEEYSGYASFNRSGLLAPELQTWNMHDPAAYLAVMRGPEELITNGQINTGLNGWGTSGRWAMEVAPGRLGGYAMAVGSLCSKTSCLTEADAAGSGAMLVLDSLGQAHTLSANGVYAVRGTDGVWQAGPALPQGSYQSLTMGLNDELLVIQTAPEAKLFRKPAGGEWSGLDLPAPVHSASLAVDGQGKVHLAYQELVSNVRGAVWVSRLEGDQWQSQHLQSLSDGLPPAYPQIAVDSAGVERIQLVQYDRLLSYRIKPDGQVSLDSYYYVGFNLQTARPVIDAQGNLHILEREERVSPDNASGKWIHTFSYRYQSRKQDGAVLAVKKLYEYSYLNNDTAISPQEWFGGLGVDDQGSVYAVVLDKADPVRSKLVHLTRIAGASEFSQLTTSLSYGASSLSAVFDKNSRAHLLFNRLAGSTYYELISPTELSLGGLKQTITLPANMHKPTLSLFYRLDQVVPDAGAGLEVWVIQPGKDPVLALSRLGPTTDWTHAWADLTPWLGQEITLELRLAQAAGKFPARLHLDEITVGSWTTPVVDSITPNQIDTLPAGGVQVRVQGENLEGAQVFLDGIAAKNVQFEAATGDLLFTLDRATKPGDYDVRVVAPSGLDAVVPYGLRVGQVVYLPMAARGR